MWTGIQRTRKIPRIFGDVVATSPSSRWRRIVAKSIEALEFPTDYYLLTQFRSTLGHRAKVHSALEALALGDVGDQSAIARRGELIRVVQHVLPFVVVTPTTAGWVLHERMAVLDRPVGTVDSLDLPPAGPLEQLYSEIIREEASAMRATDQDILDIVRETGKIIRPDLNEVARDRLAREIESEMTADPDALDILLREASESLRRQLAGGRGEAHGHALS